MCTMVLIRRRDESIMRLVWVFAVTILWLFRFSIRVLILDVVVSVAGRLILIRRIRKCNVVLTARASFVSVLAAVTCVRLLVICMRSGLS